MEITSLVRTVVSRIIDDERQRHVYSVEPISDGWQLGFFIVRDRINHNKLKFISFHCEIFKQSRYSGVQIITKYGLEKENAKILEHKDRDWRK